MAAVERPASPSVRLAPSHNGSRRGPANEMQCARMLTATVDVVEDVGYACLTVGRVTAAARVSRKTFYEAFRDREDCFLAAFEHGLREAQARAMPAYEEHSQWREQVRHGLAALLLFMDEQPALARLCVVEILATGERGLERRALLLDQLARIVDRGRLSPDAVNELPELAAEGAVCGVIGVLHSRLVERCEKPLTDLLGSLMSMIVLPYLGAGPAAYETTRGMPELPKDLRPVAEPRSNDPLADLDVRLTYRTVRVLMVVAKLPGASNTQVAQGSGIGDPGQMSKLLHRLARTGLLENHGLGKDYGASNAWSLTPKGIAVERASRLQ